MKRRKKSDKQIEKALISRTLGKKEGQFNRNVKWQSNERRLKHFTSIL